MANQPQLIKEEGKCETNFHRIFCGGSQIKGKLTIFTKDKAQRGYRNQPSMDFDAPDSNGTRGQRQNWGKI